MLVGLFCISVALLAYEILLMRLLALAYWGHFAGFVISISMLGLAASGLFLHFFRSRVTRQPRIFLAASSAVFAALAPAAFALSQRFQFAPFLLAWSSAEYGYLFLRVMLFFLPFFAAGIGIGTPFVARVRPASRLYFCSMAGAALPALPLLLSFEAVHPVRLLAPITLLAMGAAVAASPRFRIPLIAVAVAGAWIVGQIPFHFSPYKDLPKTLLLPRARILDERYDVNGLVHTVDSPSTRYLPGLSLNFIGRLPRAQLIFTDGSWSEAVFDAREALENPELLKQGPEAFSYALKKSPRVLLLYADAVEVLRGLALEAKAITTVDDVSARIAAVDEIWERFGFSPYDSPQISVVNENARHFLRRKQEPYDVILLSLLGSHGASTAGAASLDANYLLTQEGLSALLARLSVDGHAVLSAWVENPPRTGVRLAALIVDALRSRGIDDPARHILAIRSWSTLTFFITRAPYEAETVEALRRFADANSFDLVHYAGMTAAEANRYNVIPDAPYFSALDALVTAAEEQFRQRWPFLLNPPSDNAPFFGHHFRWAAVPELVARLKGEWLPFIEWGYILHVAAIVVAMIAGLLVLILPCVLSRERPSIGTGVLFFALGVAYMFVEIWAIYKLTLFLSNATVAAALTLTAMLAASGAGSFVLVSRFGARYCGWILAALLLSIIAGAALFPLLFHAAFDFSIASRAVFAALWLIIPAFFMGFPFPFSLESLRHEHEVPWALALNGLGSVIGSLGATLVAVHAGLTALITSGLVFYAIVAALCIALRKTAR